MENPNNDERGFAPQNAVELKEMLQNGDSNNG